MSEREYEGSPEERDDYEAARAAEVDEKRDPEYPSLRKEILALKPESVGAIGAMLLLAEVSGSHARTLRDAPEKREPKVTTEGYHVVIQTPNGPIGLWSCWLRDQLFLGWPRTSAWIEKYPSTEFRGYENGRELANEVALVEKCFPGVRRGPRMKENGQYIGAWTMNDPDVGAWALEQGRTMYRTEFKYIGAPDTRCDGTRFYQTSSRALQAFGYGYDADEYGGARLFSELFWHPTGLSAPRGQIIDRQYAIQEPMFLNMACELGAKHQATAVTVEMGFVAVPENLTAMGFNMPSWLVGQPGRREGWGADVVYASRTLPDGRLEEIVLESANSLVPWVCYRKQPIPAGQALTPEFVRGLLTF